MVQDSTRVALYRKLTSICQSGNSPITKFYKSEIRSSDFAVLGCLLSAGISAGSRDSRIV